MTLSDKVACRQIIGCLMQNPLLLLEYPDIYTTDFDMKVYRVCFIAIKKLYEEGAVKLTPFEVDQEIEKHENSANVYRSEHGLELLKASYEFAEPDNFKLYYTRFKKYSLLRQLHDAKYDISEYFIDDFKVDDIRKEVEIQQHFDESSIEDILNSVEGKYNVIRNEFLKGGRANGDPAEGIQELIDELKSAPNIGPNLEGAMFSSAVRGAREGCFYLKSASTSAGKALPNSVKIPTPQGMKRVDEIHIGDYLFDAFGKPTKVIGVFPQGVKEVWQVTFKDGRVAHCCKDHLWSYCTIGQKAFSRKNRKFYTKTLAEISQMSLSYDDGGYKILVPMNYAVKYPKKDLYPSPYAMGALLGDGSFRYQHNQKALNFSSSDEELVAYVANELKCGYHKNSDKNYNWSFRKYEKGFQGPDRKNLWVEEILVNYPKLWQAKSEDKFIPREYLYGSVEQRIDLLNGLLDTDGSFNESGQIEYSTISSQLKDDVIELCHSLGLKTHVYVDTHKDTNICYAVHIAGRPEDKIKLFRLQRKKNKVLQWFNNGRRKESNDFNPIVSIQKCGYSEEMTCFLVDNEEHLFLTEDYIVTHNTRTSVFDACRLAYPERWSHELGNFIYETDNQGEIRQPRKVLFIVTEMDKTELQSIMLAYLSGVNEEHILTGRYDLGELARVRYAGKIIEKYKGYFLIEEISDPNLTNVEATIKKYATIDNIKYCFFDYLHSTASMMAQFSKNNLREDSILMMMANQLKQVAKDYNIFVFSATQVNMNAMMDDGEFKNETCIRGAKSISDKADVSYVMTRVNDKTWNSMLSIFKVAARQGILDPKYIEDPNYRPSHILDIYKMRRGRYKNVRIWTKLDLGNGYRNDLFMTTADNQPVPFFTDLFNSAIEFPNNSWKEVIPNA